MEKCNTFPTNTNNSICLFENNENPICLSSDAYNSLREKLKQKYKLDELPTMEELRELLGVTNRIRLQDRIRDFLAIEGVDMNNMKIVPEYRAQVPNIYNNGLSGKNVLRIYNFLSKYYPFFHYRGPCLLDYRESDYPADNYSNFKRYPLFSRDNTPSSPQYDVYALLLLTIKSSVNRPGHWVSVCVVRNALLYYDSLNEKIEPEFEQLLYNIILELKIKYDKILTWRNKKQVQYTGKYCGVFQIHFVTTILELYKNNQLFNCHANCAVSLNEKLLNYYLQDNITQDVVENTISSYFYINV